MILNLRNILSKKIFTFYKFQDIIRIDMISVIFRNPMKGVQHESQI